MKGNLGVRPEPARILPASRRAAKHAESTAAQRTDVQSKYVSRNWYGPHYLDTDNGGIISAEHA